MNATTLMDNLLFWSIIIPVIWLVWESHKPTVYYRAYLSLIKRNYSPILAMGRAKRTRSARKA
ncbi:TPA: hypothetical protein KDZ68_003352 [Vibrio parahaemolyticus]|nr:hypothetical protein [Vibrio parahaemolyticus]